MLTVKYGIRKIVLLVNKIIGNVPYIAVFTFGEQGNIKGYGNFYGNPMMNSVVIFGNKETK